MATNIEEQQQQQQQDPSTPPISRSSSKSSRKRRSPPMSLDLSDLPPLSQPTPPSNTLLVTNLQNPALFHPDNLAHIQALINTHIAPAAIQTFSPLRSLRRIIISFADADAAIAVRTHIDGANPSSLLAPGERSSAGWESFGNPERVRVFFGEPTRLGAPEDRHLQAPKAEKQFFISPPPSPPRGWESGRHEEPPNRDAHAADLRAALERINALVGREPLPPQAPRPSSSRTQGEGPEEGFGREFVAAPQRMESPAAPTSAAAAAASGSRQRSGSTIVFHPDAHGSSPDLPAIAVEDTAMTMDASAPADEAEALQGDGHGGGTKILAHTARPPLELM